MAGTAPPSFVATLIDDSLRNDTLREDERDIMSAAASVYGGLFYVSLSNIYGVLSYLPDISWIGYGE